MFSRRLFGLALLGLGLIATVVLAFITASARSTSPSSSLSAVNQSYGKQALSLPGLSRQLPATSPSSPLTLTVDGVLAVNDSIVVQPITAPSHAVPGQIYYDAGRNQLAYYNGAHFVYLSGTQLSVSSLGGAGGAISLAPGLALQGNQLSNTGALSLQGQTGDVTLVGGSGIGIAGTTIKNTGVLTTGGLSGNIGVGQGLSTSGGQLHNTGVLQLLAGNAGITVTDDGNGSDTITSVGSGSGTVGSPGGNGGIIPVFTGSQTIANSILSQSGSTLSAAGTLSATDLQGDGSGVTDVDAVSLAGDPASFFTNASNLATGILSDARLSANVALLNSSANFTGANLQHNGNTVCDSSDNCGYLTGSSANGSYIQLQSGTPGAAQTGNYNISGTGIAGTLKGTAVFQNGNQVCDTSGNCVGTGSAGSAIGGSGTANTLALFTGTGTIGNSILTESGTTVTVGGTLAATALQGSGAAVTNLSAGNLASGTVADARLSANVTIQGNNFNGVSELVQTTAGGGLPSLDGSLLTNLDASNVSSGILSDARLSANVALLNSSDDFTGANLEHNGNQVCDTSGNCAGVGGGVTASGGTSGTIPVFTGSQTIVNSLLSQSGGTVTAAGNLSLSSGSQFEINGSQITSGNLADAANLARLNASQTFTGTNTFQPSTNLTGLAVLQTSAASPTADVFDVQAANGTSDFIQVTSTAANAGAVNINALGAGNAVSIATANSATANTGSITIQSGNATTGSNLNAGTVTIDTGTETGAGTGTISLGDVNATAINLGSASANNATITIGKNGKTTTNFNGTSFTMGADGSRNVAVTIASSGGSGVTDTIKIGNTTTAGSLTNVTIGPGAGTTAAGTEILQSEGLTDTITGSATMPTDIVQTTTNSTGTFQVQNSSGYDLLNADTSDGWLALGTGSHVNGALVFANSTNTSTAELLSGTTSSSYTLTLPTAGATGSQCLQSTGGSTTSATSLTFGSCSGSGGTTTLQQAYTASAGASPDIDMTSTNEGFTIQNDNASPITGELFGVHDKTSSGLGATLFSVANTGDATLNSNDTTGTALNETANSITTGTALKVTVNGLTTGSGITIASTSAVQTAGSLLNVNDTATLATNGGSMSGSLINVSRSLTSNIAGASNATPTLDTASTFHQNTQSPGPWTTGSMTVGSHSNRYLIVEVTDYGQSDQGSGNGYPTAVTWGSTNMQEIGSPVTIFGPSFITVTESFWALLAPATGSNTFTITSPAHDDQGSTFNMVADSWYNVSQTTPYGSFSTTSGSSGNASLTAASAANRVVVDGVGEYQASSAPTKGASQTLAASNFDSTNLLSVGSSYETASGSTTALSWTLGADSGWAEGALDLIGAPSSAETVSSNVATISNSCVINTGSVCADATNVLSVNQQYNGATGAALNVQNAGSGFGLQIQSGSGGSALTLATADLTAIDTTTSSVGATLTLGKTGQYSIAAEGTISSSLGDYAEYFPQATPGQLQPGDVACLNASGEVGRCIADGSSAGLAGVVSTSPGYVGNTQIYDATHPQNYALVSMLGQVPVHVSGANGPIHVGDLLTYDPATGLAVKATSASMTIGEALEDFSGNTGTIQLYIHIGYDDPMGLQSDGVSSGYVLQDDEATLSTLTVTGAAAVNTLRVTGNATTVTLTVTSSLAVAGSVSTFSSLTLSNTHIKSTQTNPPTAGSISSCGTGAALTFTAGDTDDAGSFYLTTGSSPNSSCQVQIDFNSAFGAPPKSIFIQPTQSIGSAATNLQPILTATTADSFTFTLPSAPTSAAKYAYYYWIIE